MAFRIVFSFCVLQQAETVALLGEDIVLTIDTTCVYQGMSRSMLKFAGGSGDITTPTLS